MHAAMSATQSAARTFTGARNLLSRVRNARGYYPIVGLAVPLAVENSSKKAQKGTETGNSGKTKART